MAITNKKKEEKHYKVGAQQDEKFFELVRKAETALKNSKGNQKNGNN